MERSITLALADQTRVVAPDTLDSITTYVLKEQRDWFEDEIRFVRVLLQPGDRVIDVGANFGVYAMTMAKAVGPRGHVWAFEPALRTAEFLRAGIGANGFSNVTLEQRALSNEVGIGEMRTDVAPELASLAHNAIEGGVYETVAKTTLDRCLDELAWRDIVFVKLDAEGEESNILKGGTRFLHDCSPLIQYEIKAGTTINYALLRQFDALGYRSFRLVPRLNALVPVQAEEDIDDFALNLFSCKQDRQKRLADLGLLVLEPERWHPPPSLLTSAFMAKPADPYAWQHSLLRFPYGQMLAANWQATSKAQTHSTVSHAIALYAQSVDEARTPRERVGALADAFGELMRLSNDDSPYLRLASLARVAADFGRRAVAVAALQNLCSRIIEHIPVDLGEPFLCPSARLEVVRPKGSIGDWVFAAALEELERLGAFSSFFTGKEMLQRLEVIEQLGYGSDEMRRRRELIQARFSGVSQIV